jgi:hypothetical protein
MDVRMVGRGLDGWRKYGWMDEKTGGWTAGLIDGFWTHGQTNRWMDRWMDVWIDV